VRSTLGQGSTFSVFLPAADAVRQEDIKDITETGRLTAPIIAARPDTTPVAATVATASASARGKASVEAPAPDEDRPIENKPATGPPTSVAGPVVR
jgi:hypothetical protein